MDKLHKALIQKIKKEKIPTQSIGLIKKNDGSPRFFEVIVDRNYRYAHPEILKRIPKIFLGIKVKRF
ncbi:MAG: hypothetical protein WCI72_05545 [archaeon]